MKRPRQPFDRSVRSLWIPLDCGLDRAPRTRMRGGGAEGGSYQQKEARTALASICPLVQMPLPPRPPQKWRNPQKKPAIKLEMAGTCSYGTTRAVLELPARSPIKATGTSRVIPQNYAIVCGFRVRNHAARVPPCLPLRID